MRKYILPFCLVALVSVASVLGVYFFQHRSRPDSEGFSYVLSSGEIERLTGKAARGDCVASMRLAKYYLYGALELDTGMKWLRIAARCPDAGSKAYLAKMLMMYKKDDSAAVVEIGRLIEEIRQIDPARATELEEQRKKMARSQ
jgi:hypothetical protein